MKTIPDVDVFANAKNKLGITEDQLSFELGAAYSVLTNHQKRIFNQNASMSVDPENVGDSLVITLKTIGSLDEEMEMESELAKILGSSEGWDPTKLCVEFHCNKEYADITE